MCFKKKQIVRHTEEEVVEQQEVVLTAKKIIFDEVSGEDDKSFFYIEKIKEGSPVILNFAKCDVTKANKVLAFLAGAIYVLGGRSVRINEYSYLFATKEEFADGSLKSFLDDLKRE